MRTVAFATHEGRPELTADDALLADAVRARGVAVTAVPWSAPADWDRFDAVVLRSTWDYHLRLPEFLAWVDALPVPLLNSPDIVRWNAHKGYLLDLAARGLAVVPLAALDGTGSVVIKPAVSASAYDTWTATLPLDAAQQARLDAMRARGDVLVQPLIPEVRTQGELSLMYANGQYTHAVLKRPADGDFRVQAELGGTTERVDADVALIEQGAAIVRAAAPDALYARVDAVVRDGSLLLMELELIEPSLFLAHGGVASFAAAVLARL